MIKGNGGRIPERTISIFINELGMNPARTIAMNHAAMKTKIHRSMACARGVPDKASGRLARSVGIVAAVAMQSPLAG
jgi:hypothetical protein